MRQCMFILFAISILPSLSAAAVPQAALVPLRLGVEAGFMHRENIEQRLYQREQSMELGLWGEWNEIISPRLAYSAQAKFMEISKLDRRKSEQSSGISLKIDYSTPQWIHQLELDLAQRNFTLDGLASPGSRFAQVDSQSGEVFSKNSFAWTAVHQLTADISLGLQNQERHSQRFATRFGVTEEWNDRSRRGLNLTLAHLTSERKDYGLYILTGFMEYDLTSFWLIRGELAPKLSVQSAHVGKLDYGFALRFYDELSYFEVSMNSGIDPFARIDSLVFQKLVETTGGIQVLPEQWLIFYGSYAAEQRELPQISVDLAQKHVSLAYQWRKPAAPSWLSIAMDWQSMNQGNIKSWEFGIKSSFLYDF